MFSVLKRKTRAFFADEAVVVEWYRGFAPAYDKIAWQTEITLNAEAGRRGVARGSGGYPRRFVRDVVERLADAVFGRMLPRFAGSGRKKAAYAFGKRAVVKLALARNALLSDFAAYESARRLGLSCLPRLMSRSPGGWSMLCEYAPPPDEKWFERKFGVPRGKACGLLGLLGTRESPSSDAEAAFAEKAGKRQGPAWASLGDIQVLASAVPGEAWADIACNDDNWGVAVRDGEEIPVLVDCGA